MKKLLTLLFLCAGTAGFAQAIANKERVVETEEKPGLRSATKRASRPTVLTLSGDTIKRGDEALCLYAVSNRPGHTNAQVFSFYHFNKRLIIESAPCRSTDTLVTLFLVTDKSALFARLHSGDTRQRVLDMMDCAVAFGFFRTPEQSRAMRKN